MNIRDYATYWFNTLEKIKNNLENLEKCGSPWDMIDMARKLSVDVNNVMQSIDLELELNMEDEE